MIKSIHVLANDDYSITVHLEDGRIIKMDMSFIKNLNGPVVDPIKNLTEFRKVFIRNGVVTWTTGYDIDPYFLVDQGVLVSKIA
jgi:hypothetical protein